MYTEYTDEVKRAVIARYEREETLKSLSEDLHIALNTLYHWHTQYCIVLPRNTLTR